MLRLFSAGVTGNRSPILGAVVQPLRKMPLRQDVLAPLDKGLTADNKFVASDPECSATHHRQLLLNPLVKHG